VILLSINAPKKEPQAKVAPGLQLRENGRTPAPSQFKQPADRLGPRPIEEVVMRQWRTRQPIAGPRPRPAEPSTSPDQLSGVSHELSHGFHSAYATKTDLREVFSAPGF
jgi:hypothetical protein